MSKQVSSSGWDGCSDSLFVAPFLTKSSRNPEPVISVLQKLPISAGEPPTPGCLSDAHFADGQPPQGGPLPPGLSLRRPYFPPYFPHPVLVGTPPATAPSSRGEGGIYREATRVSLAVF